MNTTEETIREICFVLLESYSQFEIHPESNDPKNPRLGTVKRWHAILKHLSATSVKAAVMDYVSSPAEWPPNPGQIKRKAVYLDRGELAPRGPWEAWERVVEACRNGTTSQLTDLERRAMGAAGGVHDIKSSEWANKKFISAYEEFSKSEYREAETVPAVSRVASTNAPALPPAPEIPPGRLTPSEPRASDPETVSSLLNNVTGYREEYPEGASQ